MVFRECFNLLISKLKNMKKLQERKYNMYLALKEFFATWAAILNRLPHFTEFYAIFLDELKMIEELSEQQLFDKRGHGVNIKRKELKLELIKLATQNADKLYAYALFIKDQVLQTELHYSRSTMKQSPDATVLKWSKGIYDRANLHLSEIAAYGITDATLLDFKNLISDFEILIPSQRINSTKKKLTTVKLAEHIANTEAALEHIDALVKILTPAEPTLCTTYEMRRKIVNYGNRSIAIRGLIIDDITRIGIKGVTITFLDADGMPLQPAFAKKSAAKGGFNIKSFAEGIYQVKFTKIGYKDLVVTNKIVSDELCKINVEMVKI